MARGGVNARSKWTPSTSASTLSTSTRFRSGSTTAASSPMPTRSQSGAGGSCCWMRAIRAASVRSPTAELEVGGWRSGFWASPTSSPKPLTSFRIVRGARFADHRHLDLAGIFQLVLDAPRDVLREPDGFLIGNLLALDHDADLATRLD